MTGIPILLQGGSSPWLPPQGSSVAPEVDWAFNFVFYVSLFFFALIVGLMVLFVIRYRRRKGYVPKDAPKSHLGVELVWTAIPFVVVAAIFWVGFETFLDMATPPDENYEISVVAQKWFWTFEYPNGHVDGELHVPVDRSVLLTLRSEEPEGQSAVIHSFFVPEFRVKMDVVPGRYNKTWFKATRPGTYVLLCTEYCGTGHSDMITNVVVHEPGGYEKWLREAGDRLSPLLKPREITDGPGLAARLRAGGAPVIEWAAAQLAPGTKALLDGWDGASALPDGLLEGIVADLNAVLAGEAPIFEEERFRGVDLAPETGTLLAKAGDLAGEQLTELNRFLLSDAFPDYMARGPDFVEAGRYIYERKGGCRSCHSTDGSPNTGPSLLGIYGQTHPLKDGGRAVVTDEYIRESILNPQAKIVAGYEGVMPTYQGRLTDREIAALIAFIKSLRKE